MARATFVKKALKDYPEQGIKKGESYYWWKFRYSGKIFSKTPPKPSQLTQSNFLSQYYSLQEDQAAMTQEDFLENGIEDFISSIESLKDETQGSLDNMPDQLQESDTGQLLQERIDELDNWQNELQEIQDEWSSWKDERDNIEEDEEEVEGETDEQADERTERNDERQQERDEKETEGEELFSRFQDCSCSL